MVCLYCGGDLRVTNSRPQKSRNQIWRRRLCTVCGALFTAVEAIDLSQALVVAPDSSHGLDAANANNRTHRANKPVHYGEPHPFDRDKLFISLYKSLQHRQTAAADARGLADTITAHIITKAEHGRVGSRTIASEVLNTLQRFDYAAATHYAAFHP